MNCYKHPDVSAIGTCVSCGKAVCNACATMVTGTAAQKMYCPDCALTSKTAGFAPCPKCGGLNASKVNYTWWGGFLGPRLLHHVQCTSCGTAYNSKSGKSNTTAIIIYYAVIFGIGLACVAAVFILSIANQ